MARSRMSLARMVRHYLLQWLAAIGWLVWRALEMMQHACREAVVQLSRTSTTSTQPVLPTLTNAVHINPATTIH
jgi:hypothetical protein